MKVTVMVHAEDAKISVIVTDDNNQIIDLELTKDTARKLHACLGEALDELSN